MKLKSKQELFQIVLTFEKGASRVVPVKASTVDVAINRALKRNPTAVMAVVLV